jgi:hypothetical protein
VAFRSCLAPKVKAVLAGLPTVAGLLTDPEEERDDAFPELRRTRREVYRLIATTHDEHLADVVPVLSPRPRECLELPRALVAERSR